MIRHSITKHSNANKPASKENIAFLAVLAKVESLNFLLLAHAQTQRGIEHLQNNERGHQR